MEEEDEESFFNGGLHASLLPPFISRASFITTPISSSPHRRRRRLSSSFSEPNRPIPSARRLSWVNLQGKLVNAEEASSSEAIGGCLSREEGLAWDLFSPIHRILIVAVVAVATADVKKSRQIWEIQRSRDEELFSMQQKCGCRLCDHHQKDQSVENTTSEDEMFKFKPLMIKVEQEERRMSGLSDLASSVTSSADIQIMLTTTCSNMSNRGKLTHWLLPQLVESLNSLELHNVQLNTLALEQDNYNLWRECEEKDATLKEIIKEKDATIKDLLALVKATDAAVSKGDSVEIGSCDDEMFKFKPLMINAEQEERRMSDLSDLASNVASDADIQLNSLAIEQDNYNLRREREELYATIKELSAPVKATEAGSKRDHSVEIGFSEDEMFKFKPLMIGAEQEERRMSDLSDLASSVTSAADIQLNALEIEQDLNNFLREGEQKDATIKELLALVKANKAAGSQRISELEELVRRKNMSITKLKKDRAVLEQKVVQLTRLRRPSTASTLTIKPMMADNLLYDMSNTSPSSSDSDSPIENRTRVSVNQELKETPTTQDVAGRRILQTPSALQETPTTQDVAGRRILQTPSTKSPMSLPKPTFRPPRSRPVSPLTENSMNQRLDSPNGDPIRNRRRHIHSGSKDSAQSKRWV